MDPSKAWRLGVEAGLKVALEFMLSGMKDAEWSPAMAIQNLQYMINTGKAGDITKMAQQMADQLINPKTKA